MKVLNIPAVKPHKSIGLTVAEESRFDVHERIRELGCTEIESKESRHRSSRGRASQLFQIDTHAESRSRVSA